MLISFEKVGWLRVHATITKCIVGSFNFKISYLPYFTKSEKLKKKKNLLRRILSIAKWIYLACPIVYSIGEPKYLSILRNNHQFGKPDSVLKLQWSSNSKKRLTNRCLHHFFLVFKFSQNSFLVEPAQKDSFDIQVMDS